MPATSAFAGRNILQGEFLFCPLEAEQERRRRLQESRRTPHSCGNRTGTNRSRKPRRKPGQQYDVASYRRAITRGCDLASPWPQLNGRCIKDLTEGEQVQRKAWHREHRWHPHQLRHNAGTFLRQEFGIEAARLILGHRSVSITELYAELDHRKAIEIMAEVG